MTNTNFGKSYPGNFRASWMYESKPWVRPPVEADTSDVVLAELRETTAQLEALGREPSDEISVLREALRQREAQIKELQAKVQGLVVDLDAPAPVDCATLDALDGEAERRHRRAKARKAKGEWEARKRASSVTNELDAQLQERLRSEEESRRDLARPPAWDPLGMAQFAWFLGEPGPKPTPPLSRSEHARDFVVTGFVGLLQALRQFGDVRLDAIAIALLRVLVWPIKLAGRLLMRPIFAWVLTMFGVAYGVADLAFGHFLLGPITVIGWSVYFIAVMSHKSNTRRPNHRLGTARVERAAPKVEEFTVPCKGGCGKKLLAGSRPMCMTCRDRVDRARKMRGGISEYQARALEEAKQSKCTDCG